MRRSLLLAALSLVLAGCAAPPSSAELEKAGLGIVPLNGATVTGKVIEASQPDGVLLKTSSNRSFLLPQDWQYRSAGKPVPVKKLQPGSTVTAVAPSTESRLLSAADNTLLLGSEDGFFSFPIEGLSESARAVPVQVRTTGGQQWDMPLGHAVRSYPDQIVNHPYYNDYDFPVADPYTVHKGLPVGAYGESPLLLAPGPQGGQLVQLPAIYPRQQLVSHQPVRFTYLDNDVTVSSWNTLGDGQFDLGKLLLAGTLLDVLPGQAIIEVGQSPVAVPWNYVTYQGDPIGPRRFPVGTPVGIQYHPGVYDMVSYDYDNMTLMYNHQPVQVPISCLPDYSYRQPVKVRPHHGDWVRMPFEVAQPLLARGDYTVCPSPVAMPYLDYWKQDQWAWQPRPVRGRPDLRLVGQSGFWPPRVVRWNDDERRGHRWDRRKDRNHTPNWAGPAVAWNSFPQPLVNWHPASWDGRQFGYQESKGYGKRGYGERDRRSDWNDAKRGERRHVSQRNQQREERWRTGDQRGEQRRVHKRNEQRQQRWRPDHQRGEQRRVSQRNEQRQQRWRPDQQRGEQRRVSQRNEQRQQRWRPDQQRQVAQRSRGEGRGGNEGRDRGRRGGGRDRR